MPAQLFPFAEYWWFYAVFGSLILVLLVIDLSAHRASDSVSMRGAVHWTGVWLVLGMSFSVVIYLLAAHHYTGAVARRLSVEYLTGYLVEESLSIDNMFVFALIFRYFSLGAKQQHRVLFYGILGAMILRGLFIAAGSALIQFRWVVLAFGIFLVVSGVRMAFAGDRKVEPDRNPVIRLVRRFLPVTEELHGNRFVVRRAGVLYITPLMVILLVLESTDVVFAVDSVPAVFAVTKEPLIVYTSNIFAVLGLRAMYFVLAGALDRFHLLKYGLSVILVFVGLKMAVLDELAGGRLPGGFSLGVIVVTVLASMALSLLFPRTEGWDPRRLVPIARVAVGSLFAILSCASLAIAAGGRPALLPVPALDVIQEEWLYVSGICYAICGWLLLRSRRTGGTSSLPAKRRHSAGS